MGTEISILILGNSCEFVITVISQIKNQHITRVAYILNCSFKLSTGKGSQSGVATTRTPTPRARSPSWAWPTTRSSTKRRSTSPNIFSGLRHLLNGLHQSVSQIWTSWNWLWWFMVVCFRLELIFDPASADSNNDTRFKSGQKGLENNHNHLTLLI